MSSYGQIQDLDAASEILQFAAFISAAKGDRAYVSYAGLDLMRIPRLVPKVFVFDFTDGIAGGLVFKFSGTELDAFYGKNVTGMRFQDIYFGDDRADIFGIHESCYLQKRPGYARRYVRYRDKFREFVRTTETLLFPCSDDGETINYGIGLIKFGEAVEWQENIYLLL